MPYIFSASQNFDSLLWQTRFYDVPNQNNPQYFLHSMTQVSDGFIVAGDYLPTGDSPLSESGVLFKASLDGDSLWMKHYIPLNWGEDRVAWVNFNDVKTTPDGNLIIVGSIGDLELQIVRPWILHIDSDGCLVPGCNIVGTNDKELDAKDNKFTIYPNPAHDELYLLSSITSTEEVNIEIITFDGIIISSKSIMLQSGYQYILPIFQLSPGIYHLVFSNEKKHVFESHSFVKQ